MSIFIKKKIKTKKTKPKQKNLKATKVFQLSQVFIFCPHLFWRTKSHIRDQNNPSARHLNLYFCLIISVRKFTGSRHAVQERTCGGEGLTEAVCPFPRGHGVAFCIGSYSSGCANEVSWPRHPVPPALWFRERVTPECFPTRFYSQLVWQLN